MRVSKWRQFKLEITVQACLSKYNCFVPLFLKLFSFFSTPPNLQTTQSPLKIIFSYFWIRTILEVLRYLLQTNDVAFFSSWHQNSCQCWDRSQINQLLKRQSIDVQFRECLRKSKWKCCNVYFCIYSTIRDGKKCRGI